MATLSLVAEELRVYDPDGASNPVTLEFPDTTTLPQGTTVKIFNVNRTSSTSVTLSVPSGSPSDKIQDPNNPTVAPTAPITFARKGYTAWFLITDGHANPTWYVHENY